MANLKSGWIWANVISTVIIVAVCVTAYVLFHNKWAVYKWQDVQTIEIERIVQPDKPGEYISKMNTIEGWYRENEGKKKDVCDYEGELECQKYIMWNGYTENDLNVITWGKVIIVGTMALYSIFFLVAVIFLNVDKVDLKVMFFYVLVYIIINLIIEVILVIFDACQIDRYNKKHSEKEDISGSEAIVPGDEQPDTEPETESYTPYKFVKDVSEGFSNIKKMLRRY